MDHLIGTLDEYLLPDMVPVTNVLIEHCQNGEIEIERAILVWFELGKAVFSEFLARPPLGMYCGPKTYYLVYI